MLLLLLCCCTASCTTLPATPLSPPATHISSPLLGTYSYTPSTTQGTSGKVILSGTAFPDTANPLFASSSVDFALDTALWGQPVFYDQQFHVQPDQLTEVPLPENGDVQDGGKTIIMHLRHDLQWSDGQPILASDFQYWWQLNQDPNTGATITSGYDQIASIDTPDAYTVVLHMKHPFGPYLFSLPYAAPRHAWAKLHPIDLQNTAAVFQAPAITSGPYKLLSMHDGKDYTLVPNANYHSSTFRGPFISQLTYRGYENLSTLSRAVQQGATDVSMGYEENDLASLAHLPPTIQIREIPAAAYEHLDFNNANPLFHDVIVRRAIQMALDVCGMLKVVVHTSDCTRSTSQVELPPSLYYDASIQPVQYAPEAAKKLLVQAGWIADAHGLVMQHGHPFTIRLVTTANNPTRAALAEWIRRNLLAIGIQVQLVYAPLNTFFGGYTTGGILATGAYDLALFTYSNSPEPDDQYNVFHSSQIPDANHPNLGNYARINDPIIDQALIQGRTTVVFADRVAAYHHFLERVAEQVYIIPLYTDMTVMTVNTHIHNVILNPNQVATTWNIGDWWVSP